MRERISNFHQNQHGTGQKLFNIATTNCTDCTNYGLYDSCGFVSFVADLNNVRLICLIKQAYLTKNIISNNIKIFIVPMKSQKLPMR